MKKYNVKVTAEMQGNEEVMVGDSFIGTIITEDESHAFVAGSFSDATLVELTSTNISAIFAVGREAERDPEKMLELAVKSIVVAITKAASRIDKNNLTAYDKEFLRAAMTLALELMP